MSGSVKPLTGARPADIVMLYSTWNVKLASTPSTRYAPSRSFASLAASSDRRITNRYNPSATCVLRRVDEGRDSFLLIVLQRKSPGDGRRQQADQRQDAKDAHRHPGE